MASASAHRGDQAWIPEDARGLRRLRTMLVLGFGGLLAIMVVAGLGALRTLRDLHSSEEDARREYVTRNQAISMVTYSVHLYSDEVEQILLTVRPAQPTANAAADISRALSDARAAFDSYPGPRDPVEQQLLQFMNQQLLAQERTVETILSWTPDERFRRGPVVVYQNLLPARLQMLETSQQIAALNRNHLNDSNASLFARFGQLRDRLTWMIGLGLGAGILLSLLSAGYILRLERQAERRYAELAKNRRDLEDLSSRLVDAQEAERRSISRELHDEVGQSLGALLMEVGRVKALVPPENVQALEQLNHIRSVAEETVRTVRNMALLLRPSMLDDLGLVPALEWQGREVSRTGKLEVEVHSENVSERLPDEFRICIYRLVQEALNNAARHASARVARVNVIQSTEKIVVEVTDDGKGFDPARERGLGLVGMEERVKRLGGALSIRSKMGQGTTIRAELPLSTPELSDIHEKDASAVGG